MRSLASAAMAGAAAFTVVVLAFHLLRPDLDPALDYISYYAVGRYGALMVAAFVALGLGCVALALAVRGATRGAISLIGCTLLGLAGLGLIVGGIAPSDLEGAPPTTTGAVHLHELSRDLPAAARAYADAARRATDVAERDHLVRQAARARATELCNRETP